MALPRSTRSSDTRTSAPDAAPGEPALSRSARVRVELAVLAAAAVPRIWAAVADQGLFWPDEIYQSLEQAHRFAFGYGLIPWEFEKGARSWLFPGVLGLFWKLCAGFGVSRSLTLIVLAKLLMVAGALAGIWVAMRFAQAIAGPVAGICTGILSAAFPMSLVYGSRCMTEGASGPLLVAAAWLTLEPRSEPGPKRTRDLRLAGALAALAVFLRYQNGVVLLLLLGLLALRKRWADAKAFASLAAAVGLAGGALDWATWGKPFWSFIEYLQFNLVEGKASQWGTSDATFYFHYLWTSTGWLGAGVVAAGLVGAASSPRGRDLLGIAGVYLFLHILIPHKELRFLLPVVPLAMVAAGAGLAGWLGAKPSSRWLPAGIALAACAPMGLAAAHETFDSMGQYTDQPTRHGGLSPWHDYEGFNRLMAAAGERPDLCGAMLVGVHPAWTGGYSYLHRDVPLFFFQPTQTAVQGSNYAIGPAGLQLSPYESIETDQGYALYRRDGACVPPPTRSYILP